MNYAKNDLVRVRGILVEVASRRERITYTELANRAQLTWNHRSKADRAAFGRLLGEVSSAEYARGRPLLTAVVVRKDTREPGTGFLGLEDFPKTREFWLIELKRVQDFWAWD
jgi:hypothetical protein